MRIRAMAACLLGAALFFMPVAGLAEGTLDESYTVIGEITHYCACASCNGSDCEGMTASGIEIQDDMENPYIVACNWLPLGSVVEVDGQRYTVADRGGRKLSVEGRLDIFVPEGHKAALKLGRKRGVSVTVVSVARGDER